MTAFEIFQLAISVITALGPVIGKIGKHGVIDPQLLPAEMVANVKELHAVVATPKDMEHTNG